MAFPFWALYVSAKHFDEYLKFGKTHRLKTWRCLLSLFLITSQFLDFIHCIIFFLLRDSENDLLEQMTNTVVNQIFTLIFI